MIALELSYAIGVAEPLSITVFSFGTSSKTTTELSSELNDVNDEKNDEDKELGRDEATEVAEVGGSKEGEVEIEISEEDQEMIKSMFQHFDSDKSGKMSIAELGNFMRAIGKKLSNNNCQHL